MDWFIDPYQLEEILTSKPPSPPYFLIAAGLFICLTSGLSFIAAIRAQMGRWYRNFNSSYVSRWLRLQLAFPFAGIGIGVSIFLSAMLMALGLPTLFSWLAGVLLTLLIGAIVWSILGKRMGQRAVGFYLDQQMHQS